MSTRCTCSRRGGVDTLEVVHDRHVSFQANWSRHGAVNLSGSEPLTWYGVHTGERISEISADDMIDHLIDVFRPHSSETLWDQDND